MKWSVEEDNLLKENYQLKKKELLQLFPNRTAAAVNIRASQLKLRKEKNEYIQSNSSVLLENTLESYYWIGFILADGHISKNFRLTITLAKKDSNHLMKLKNYIEASNIEHKLNSNKCGIKLQDKYYIRKLVEKFDISNRKTYNPPEFYVESDDLFLALFIGYIDGDGQIRHQFKRKDCCICIHIHSSWTDLMNCWIARVNKICHTNSPLGKVTNNGYYRVNISNSIILNKLKEFVIKNNLPVLSRKWDLIDLNYISRYIASKINRDKIKSLYEKNKTPTQISKELGLSRSNVYGYLYRLGLL